MFGLVNCMASLNSVSLLASKAMSTRVRLSLKFLPSKRTETSEWKTTVICGTHHLVYDIG